MTETPTLEALVVLCTAPDETVATELARGLVHGGLAACVSLVPRVRSIYRWQGAVEEADEVQLIIKTTAARLAEVEAHLASAHPFEVPEIIALPLQHVEAKYLAWMGEQTR